MAEQIFKGRLVEFPLGKTRKFVDGLIKYSVIRKFVELVPFDAETGEGEQRVPDHPKKLKTAMDKNVYAPSVIMIGTRDSHRKAVAINNGVASLTVGEADKLPLLDGGNRVEAWEMFRQEGGVTAAKIDAMEVPYLLVLDGDLRQDFIAYQASKPASRDHILSMKISSDLVDTKVKPFYAIAKEAARTLHTNIHSFCHNLIQFDALSKGVLSFSSLSTKGASDIGFSLFGGAKIAANYDKDATWLANCVLAAYRTIRETPETEHLLKRGNILAPIPDGTKAGTTMLIALGNMLAARCLLRQVDEPEANDLLLLKAAALNNMDKPTKGYSSNESKRELLRQFAVEFFGDLVAMKGNDEDIDEELDVPVRAIGAHHGIPVAIIRLLSPSTFNLPKLPSETKKRGRKPKATKAADAGTIDENDDMDDPEIIVGSAEDPIDAEAFAEMDARAEEAAKRLAGEDDEVAVGVADVNERAPWDDEVEEETE
jgi:hypothetical protein